MLTTLSDRFNLGRIWMEGTHYKIIGHCRCEGEVDSRVMIAVNKLLNKSAQSCVTRMRLIL